MRAGLPPGPGNTAARPAENADTAALTADERLLLEEEKGERLDARAIQEQRLLTSARNGNLEVHPFT